MGQIRAKILHSNPRVDLCGVVDTAGKGGDLASMYQIPEYQCLKVACEKQTRPLDAVVVCTPTHSHSEVIMLAASYGLDMFVEKPVAESASAMEDLFERVLQFTHASRSRPVALCCGFQRRFDPSYQAAMNCSFFGKPITARIFFGDHPVPPIEFLLNGGDIFMDLAAHDVDYITHVWKEYRVESVFAVASASSPQMAEAGVQDHATVLLQFEGGESTKVH
jgi:myo-inositol 2-dehydrogenase/D-chiro-inositol 1-dehydrogenase